MIDDFLFIFYLSFLESNTSCCSYSTKLALNFTSELFLFKGFPSISNIFDTSIGSTDKNELYFYVGIDCIIEHFKILFFIFLYFFSTRIILLSWFSFPAYSNSLFCISNVSLILVLLYCSLLSFYFSLYISSNSYVINWSYLNSTKLILGFITFCFTDTLFGTTL